MKLIESLDRSAATAAFRNSVAAFLQRMEPNERVGFPAQAPLVKVERTLIKVLEEYSELPIEGVQVTATSGCATFRGYVTIRTADEERRVNFDWDCKWKALEMGWTDYFGFPDQARAAREFGHECFRSWQEVPTVLVVEA
jgi:hypothetical protein